MINSATQELNMRILIQAQSRIKSELQNFSAHVYRVSKQPEIRELLETETTDQAEMIIRKYHVSNMLNDFSVFGELFSDFGVYFSDTDSFVRAQSACTLKEFYQIYLKNLDDGFEKFSDIIMHKNTKGHFVHTKESLLYCQSLSLQNVNGNVVVIGVVNNAWLYDVIESFGFQDDIYVGALAEDNELISLKDADIGDIDLEKIKAEKGSYISNGKFVMFSKLDDSNYKMVFIMDKNILSGDIGRIFIILIIVVILAFCLVMLLSYRNIRHMFDERYTLSRKLETEFERNKRGILYDILRNVYDEYEMVEKQRMCHFHENSMWKRRRYPFSF